MCTSQAFICMISKRGAATVAMIGASSPSHTGCCHRLPDVSTVSSPILHYAPHSTSAGLDLRYGEVAGPIWCVKGVPSLLTVQRGLSSLLAAPCCLLPPVRDLIDDCASQLCFSWDECYILRKVPVLWPGLVPYLEAILKVREVFQHGHAAPHHGLNLCFVTVHHLRSQRSMWSQWAYSHDHNSMLQF